MDINRDFNYGDIRKILFLLNIFFNSEFINEFINYYMNGGGLLNDEEIFEIGKKVSMLLCMLKFGK